MFGIDRIIGNDNSFIKLIKSASGVGKLGDLMKTIYNERLLSAEYHFFTEDCKHFASAIFNKSSSGSCSVGHIGDLLHPVGRGSFFFLT